MEQKSRGSSGHAAGPAGASRARQPENLTRPGGVPDVQVGMCSHRGPKRDLNEDLAGYRVPRGDSDEAARGALFVVADGMGGHQAGEVASRMAVETVIREYFADTEPHPGERLVRAAKVANRAIYEHALLDPARSGMGTTLVAAAVVGSRVYVANVGDSRAYILMQAGASGASELRQITVDHSWVAEQVEVGLLTRDQVAAHPQRNVITRALGTQPSVVVDLFKGDLVAGDTLLLCSDGVCGAVPEPRLVQILSGSPPQDAAEELVAQAALHGGDDNATALVVHAKSRSAVPSQPGGDGKRPGAYGAAGKQVRAKVNGEPAAAGFDGAMARVQQRARALAATVLTAVEPVATRLGLPAASSGSAGAKGVWIAAAAALSVLVCLCMLAVAAYVIGRGQAGDVAPEIKPIAASELPEAPEQRATYLGYVDVDEMKERHAGDDEKGWWPARMFVRVAGKASKYKCDGAEYTFQLDVADQVYTITYTQPETDIKLNGEQVRVVAEIFDHDSHTLTATVVEWDDDKAKDRHNWQRFVCTIPDTEQVWVYGIADDLIWPAEQGGLSLSGVERRVLILGAWSSDGASLDMEAGYVYQEDDGTYRLWQRVEQTPQPEPTSTLQPTNTPGSRPPASPGW